ncbi:DUF1350 family protein [Thermostichus vulcanus]|uniref:DUF1350 family protein n=1 Tax=Thermostichus vulcanus str. 'Rupite' TaxID=2813851 RepID=A0ABT0CED6_THEVL|nr:DUF1350 family protein [Thermostichus vulcanus]MCJ2544146.1 DUF1350 family protein [Thermostichus vulcanus str. 'Rupite']
MSLTWQTDGQTWFLLPSQPRAVVHFLGGAFVGAAPQFFYSRLLEELARMDMAIVATPYTTDIDHAQLAFSAVQSLQIGLRSKGLVGLPLFGLGHSLGCKLQILSCLMDPSIGGQRQGNIFLAYSNAGLDQALPLLRLLFQTWPQQQVTDLWRMWMGSSSPPMNWWVEFEPSPVETNRLIEEQYPVRNNLLLEFRQDDIDDIPLLYQQLRSKYPGHTEWQHLEGDHLTPLGLSYPFRPGVEFSPIDAVGQLVYQTLLTPNQAMIRCIQAWLAAQLA